VGLRTAMLQIHKEMIKLYRDSFQMTLKKFLILRGRMMDTINLQYLNENKKQELLDQIKSGKFKPVLEKEVLKKN
jgi:hypothetical protein